MRKTQKAVLTFAGASVLVSRVFDLYRHRRPRQVVALVGTVLTVSSWFLPRNDKAK